MDPKDAPERRSGRGRETGGAQVVHRSSHRLQTSQRLRDERRKRRRRAFRPRVRHVERSRRYILRRGQAEVLRLDAEVRGPEG